MTHSELKPKREEFMRVFLLAGLLDIAFGLALLAVPLPPAAIQGSGNANMELQTIRSERRSPLTSVILLACGIALIVTARPGRRKPEPLLTKSSPITLQAPGSTGS
jgi:hypothetical protein